MINSKEAYEERGRRAAQFRNMGDEASAQDEARHFRAMRALEDEEGKSVARAAYSLAYELNRRINL